MRSLARRIGAFLLLSLAISGRARGADDFERRTYRDGRGETLPYRLFSPRGAGLKASTTYPLVLFLHGAGQRGTDNEMHVKNARAWARPEVQAEHPCFIVAPQCPPDRRWVEVDWNSTAHAQPEEPSRPMGLLLSLIPSLREELPIDPRRTYVTGLSMGGYGAWDILARRPDWFAAAVPICGGADLATAPRIARVPAWVFHGDRDVVVPVSRSRDIVEALRKAGGSPRFTEYRGVGHQIWEVAYAEAELPPWLFSQRRGP